MLTTGGTAKPALFELEEDDELEEDATGGPYHPEPGSVGGAKTNELGLMDAGVPALPPALFQCEFFLDDAASDPGPNKSSISCIFS